MTGDAPAVENILEVHDVRRVFGGVVALAGISLAVPKGKVVGLIGPNGSGKTTLVNVISGMLRPTSGTVQLKGKTISGLPTHRIAKMGLSRTFQVVRPFTNMTVLENVAIGAMFGGADGGHSAAAAMQVARTVLDRVGLGSRADAPAEELTVMGRKRLELARALASGPDVLLLDEVLAGLRSSELEEAISLVRSVSESGVTILIIEHVLRVIVSLCDQIVVINRGQKIAEGVPDVVMRNQAVIDAYLGHRASTRHNGPTFA
ncbi:MAG: ABC transporter ATP-binding protein [Tepidiformaceae bacterium]